MRTNWPDERILRTLGAQDPVTEADFCGSERSEEARRLLQSVLEAAPSPGSARAEGRARSLVTRSAKRSWRGPALIAMSIVGVVILLVGVLVNLGSGPGTMTRLTTPWQAGQGFHGGGHGRSGHWQLVDDPLSGTWQQYTYGPPGGGVCPTATACYVMAGHFASPSSTEPETESFYVSTDVGATWAKLPMPSGFIATSRLSCAGATVCAAGGIFQNQSVLVSTTDGGHSFTISPLPPSLGKIRSLSCRSSTFCAALGFTQSRKGLPPTVPIDATLLSTSDGGKTFTDAPILPGVSMYQLVCTSTEDCMASGSADATPSSGQAPSGSVSAVTTDGGRSWKRGGSFPAGFQVFYGSLLSCPDALDCHVVGLVPSSPSKPQTLVNGIATTTDGGSTWTEEALPTGVTRPFILGLSCPTVTECWASGSNASQVSGTRSILLGTTNGGASWSVVTFTKPTGAPDYQGQAYLEIGAISCPTAGVCAAWGAISVGQITAPVYSLRS